MAREPNVARSLLRRLGDHQIVSADALAMLDNATDEAALFAVEVACDCLCHAEWCQAEDASWYRDFLEWTGEHHILTDEGWIPGELQDQDDPCEVVDEVNAPPTPPSGPARSDDAN